MKKRFIAWLNGLKLRFFLHNFYYIHGTQALPAPLNKEQEETYVIEAAAGSANAREELIVHNLRLVVYIAKKFEGTHAHLEDLISIGSIGLIKAVNTFRPEKNIKLATYASRCIENEILMFLRKISSRKVEVSIDEPLNIDGDGNELLLSDVLGGSTDEIHENIEQHDEHSRLLRCVQALPAREQNIMYLRSGLDGGREFTQKEVAQKLGISQSYISRLEKRILEKLKNELENVV